MRFRFLCVCVSVLFLMSFHLVCWWHCWQPLPQHCDNGNGNDDNERAHFGVVDKNSSYGSARRINFLHSQIKCYNLIFTKKKRLFHISFWSLFSQKKREEK